MTEQEIVAFKNELRNYRFYESKIKELTQEINKIYYELTGVKGICYDRQPGSTSPEAKSGKMYDSYNKIDALSSKLSVYKAKFNSLECVLNKLDCDAKKLIINVYVEGKTYRELSEIMKLSPSAIHYEVTKHLKGL